MESELHTIGEVSHSLTGASGMPRWENCAGSVNLIRKLGDRALDSGVDAALGTAAHSVLSQSLDDNVEPWEFMGEKYHVGKHVFVADADMINAVSVAQNFITTTIRNNSNAKVIRLVEKSMQHSEHADLYGTTDVGLVVITETVKLIVIDYKHGIHVNVEPTSSQLKYYAALLVDYLLDKGIIGDAREIAEVELWVVQPRQPHPEGLIRSHVMTGDELQEWAEGHLMDSLEATKDPNALLTVGAWCGFCPARAECPALRRATLDLDTSVEPSKLSAEDVTKIKLKGVAIKKFLEMVDKVALDHARKGHKLIDPETGHGFKLVDQKMNRAWKNGAEKTLKTLYGNKIYTKPEFKSPAQIEKTIPGSKDEVAKIVFTPNGGLTLAPLTDKRLPVRAPMDAFKELIDMDAEI